ncbi:hypothetical protein [Hydrogenimonas sp. SS33]|uniref:hypothetical protein n=1 Tax=Hydrogenimonas leucolamina TaxID=2954236 RepID=UPI00336C22BF
MGLGIFSIFIIPVLAAVILAIFLDRKSKAGYGKKLIISILFLLPFTYDIIITNLLGFYYCKIAPPHPKTLIAKKVAYPESIYWEDNVYPGFSKEDRELMIINYLDGEHLKTMALNGPENKKVYVYHLDRAIWKEFKKRYEAYVKQHPPKQDRFSGHGFDIYRAYAKEIMKTEKIYTKKSMPKTNYTVTFNEVKLNPFARHFLYSDETRVTENKTGKVIAYNRRYMHFFYNIFPDFELGDRYYDPDTLCGKRISLERGLFGYFGQFGSSLHEVDVSRKLYKKYIKGEK